jgi:hypothetical protein
MRTPSLYRPKGYTGCLEGFFRSARQRKKTILRNNKSLGRRFTHLANINLTAPRHPALINRDFRAFLKELEKRGVTGHWTIEIDLQNIVHWHLLFVDFFGSSRQLKALVTRCVRAVETFPARRIYTDSVRNQSHKLDYVLKAKKQGHGEVFNPLDHTARPKRSRECRDIYARDRVLFRPNTGLDKHGTFGDFWARDWSEKKWWNLICEETEEVAKNYKNQRIREFVNDIHSRLGIPLERVKWAYCLRPPGHLLARRTARGSSHCRRGAGRCSSGLVGLLFLRRPAVRCPMGLQVASMSSIERVVASTTALPGDTRYRVATMVTMVNSVAAGRSPEALERRGSLEFVCRHLVGPLRHGLQQGPPYRSLAP